ncbi:hypothetical protein [Actinomadura atramentaria]|uniref:hypothetical protein n=1 Tax=Actinomadura atramentaria TaxID=1990 RepID=UPI0003666571|nr:hypothetical protein [Actinomadura atramentaria]
MTDPAPALRKLGAAEWDRPLGGKFGAYGDRTTLDLAIHVLDEFSHHTAEIGVLRDLYPHRHHVFP